MSRRNLPKTFTIAGRPVGPGHRPFVIAEVAQGHDGSLGIAHSFIDVAAECGADAIKFQTHIADAESTRDEPFRVNFSFEDTCRIDYWRRIEFSREGWAGLAAHARDRGLVFLSTPFSLDAVDLLVNLDMPAWKVASGEVRHEALIAAMLATGKPILLSSGLSAYQALDETIARIARPQETSPLAIFQCTTRYPTPLEEVGLNILQEFSTRYGVPVGLSDHSAMTTPSIAAMALGASLIEVHIAFHRRMFGPDVVASLTPDQLLELCRARDAVHTMLTNPVDKDDVAAQLMDSATPFSRSLALKAGQRAGTIVTAEMLALKKPGSGIPETDLSKYVGRRLVRDVDPDRLLSTDDFAQL